MFCPSCSHQNVDEAKFCAKCGAPLRVQAAPTPTPPVTPPVSPSATTTVSNGMKWGIAAGSILIPILGIVMGVIYMRDVNPDKKAAGKLWLGVGIGMVVIYILNSMSQNF